jgi:hypothetical protein
MPKLDLSEKMVNMATEPVDIALESERSFGYSKAWEAWEKKNYRLALKLMWSGKCKDTNEDRGQ